MAQALRQSALRASAIQFTIFACAVAIGGLAIALARNYRRPEPHAGIPPPGMSVSPASVTLTKDAPMWSVIKLAAAEPAAAHWSELMPARVVFDETRAARLGSPLGGRVTAVMVVRGQQVTSGSPVFSVTSRQLAELRADLAKAKVVQTTSRASFQRIEALMNTGVVPAKEFVNIKGELAAADLAVELATQKLASLRVGEAGGDSTFTIAAPRDGVVVELNVAVGQEVDAASGALVAIADLSTVWVVADLFEDDVGVLAPGTLAKVFLDSAEFEGTIDQVSAIVDPERHTVPVRVKLPNPDGRLRPNAYAQIRFFDPSPAKVAVPASALMTDGAKSYVYVETERGVLKRRDVTIGSARDGKVPVLAGLEADEIVVVQGAILLDNQIQLDY